MKSKIKEHLKKFTLFSVLSFIGIVSLISLLLSNPEENNFFKFDSLSKDSENLFNIFFSTMSDFLFNIFGFVAYLFCFFFIFNAIRIFLGKQTTWYSWFTFPITIILLCFLFESLNKQSVLPHLSSGILGDGLIIHYEHLVSNLEYSEIMYSLIVFLFFVSFFLTFNIGYSEIKKSLIIFIRIICYFGLLFGRALKLTDNRSSSLFTFLDKDSSFQKIKKLRKIKKSSKTTNPDNYVFPSIEFLEKEKKIPGIELENKKNTELNTSLLAGVLKDFKISGNITDVKQGPIVTLFELTPAPGTLSSSVIRLSEDIARSMSAKSTRISTIAGKDAIGIEIPNKQRQTVFLRELINDPLFSENKFKLPLALGKDIFGKPVIVDLSKMPHLLVAGTTGSGKSVGINAMLLSLLYYLPPEECRLILIDPKMLELSVYQDIPHLLTEVVTDPKKAISALKWTVKEMEKRYQMMTHLEVREIDDYNKKVRKILETGQVIFKEMQVGYDSETGKPVMEKKALDLSLFPKIVVVVDELADLMITSGKEIEGAIQRLSQMARAAGIHLIVATQRPSVDVITGTIKSNFPSRISYKVVNKINSRTILEEQGAEQLLGQGDLLLTMLGENLLRVHGPFVKTEEVQSVVNHLKKQGEPEYLQSVTKDEEDQENYNLAFNDSGDELYDRAVSIVCREKKASTSFIQRHLQIGYNRAARIIEKMESEGIVSPANHVGRREVLVGKDS